ncbi:MAG: hypothetical protein WCS74_03055 [Dehalococcoidales bacterium]|jgi:hypothetical protein|nr:hypothetical protein [Dehalococcoidales bacterium]MDD3264887.1 hypothetical protein [Dehalococcoidales bacterium]MDD4322265.1 hypothetical protein [Dehalococcoidales bacterium]MDD4794375.1 hypothetical protein [Dehalococcoidales bacterium]MDD5122045.1 hypothetical protein [Dehalococcoidales bacterium]
MTKKTVKEDKKDAELANFIESVNKKDDRNGLKIRFAFVNRKRKG